MLDDLLRIALEVWPARFFRAVGLTRADFRGYQNRFVVKIHEAIAGVIPGLILALPPGAGKTVTVLTALRDALDEGTIRKALITAPLFVAKTVWGPELAEWPHLADTTYTVLRAEDNDPEIAEVSERVYRECLERAQAWFDAEVVEARRGNPSKASALAIVRARWEACAAALQSDEDREKKRKPKGTPSDFAERERQVAVAAAKERMLQRLAAEPTELHIINKEALPWIWQHFRNGHAWPYDVQIVDDLREGRSGKHRSKGGAKGEKGKGAAPLSRWGVLARIRKHVKTTIIMTGTPTPKGLENLWGLAYLVDLGARLGTAKTAFLDRWFKVDKYNHSITPNGLIVDKSGAVLESGYAFYEITSKMKDIMFSIDEADLGELPPFIINPIRVKLSPQVLDAYKTFERTMVAQEYDVEAVNGGVLHGKLLQFANGSMYRDDGEDVFVHDEKIEALKDLVERLDGSPLLVAYTYKFDVERICAAFPQAVVLAPENAVETVRLWNEDKIAILLAHRASAGHGLNMQKGTGNMCEYGLTSDAELYLQFLKRILRPGRKTKVFNHVIIAEGTIDEDVFPSYLDPKIETQDRILAEMRMAA